MPENSAGFAVSFTETLEEYEEIYELAVQEARKNRTFSRRMLEVSCLWSPLLVVLLLTAMLMGRTGLDGLFIMLVALGLFGLLALVSGTGLLTSKGLSPSIRREVSRLFEAKKCHVHELAIGIEKFVSRCPCGLDERVWSAIEAWYETDRQFLLKTGGGCYYAIAKRAISQEDYPQIQGLLVSKLGSPIRIEKEKGPRELMSPSPACGRGAHTTAGEAPALRSSVQSGIAKKF